eukprot:4939463-Lingulodinium_polyedra.AAC.1
MREPGARQRSPPYWGSGRVCAVRGPSDSRLELCRRGASVLGTPALCGQASGRCQQRRGGRAPRA